MTYALLDNATLTTAQRLVGTAESRSRDSVDGDIAALDNLIEGTLFYDEIVCIDDYKPEFRADRQNAFPFINFLSPTDFLSKMLLHKPRLKQQRFDQKFGVASSLTRIFVR